MDAFLYFCFPGTIRQGSRPGSNAAEVAVAAAAAAESNVKEVAMEHLGMQCNLVQALNADFNLSEGCFPILLRIFYKCIQFLCDV